MTISLETYLNRRGYKVPLDNLNHLTRWWLVSFAQPGFNLFWRIWNPILGYLLYQMYCKLGGRKRPLSSLLLTFAFSGFIFHDLVWLFFKGEFTFGQTLTILIFATIFFFYSKFRIDKFQRKLHWI